MKKHYSHITNWQLICSHFYNNLVDFCLLLCHLETDTEYSADFQFLEVVVWLCNRRTAVGQLTYMYLAAFGVINDRYRNNNRQLKETKMKAYMENTQFVIFVMVSV